MIRWFYLRDLGNPNKFPVACVATMPDKEGNIRFAVSAHRPSEPFDRRTAIGYAVNRLLNGDSASVLRGERVKERIIAAIADPHGGFPVSAQIAAQQWIESRKEETAA